MCRTQWLMHKERFADAARLMLAAAPATMALQDTDQWWRERRVLARKLLDLGEYRTAYEVVREAALPANEILPGQIHFMPGWIALRYLNEPATARELFAHIDDGSTNPIVLARAVLARPRRQETSGEDENDARLLPGRRPPYHRLYGQLARFQARPRRHRAAIVAAARSVSRPAFMAELARAANLLYAIGERDLVLSFATDLAESRAPTSQHLRRLTN